MRWARQTFFVILLALTSAILAQAAQAANNPWSPFGPGGGTPQGLAVDPRNPAVVYAAAGVLYRSADRGETWTGLFGRRLETVALDPARPATTFVGGDVLARSTDGGRTWKDTSPRGISLDVKSLAVLPGKASVVLAASSSLLLRSTNGGRSWSWIFANGAVRSVVADPGAPRTVYYSDASGLHKSTDAGKSWSLTGPVMGRRNLPVGLVALAPSTPGTLYVIAGSGIHRSDDGGRSWRQVGEIPATLPLDQAFLVDPQSPSRLYLAGQGGVFGSADGGATWTQLASGLPQLPLQGTLAIYALAADPSRPGILYAGTYEHGVAMSADGGESWRIGVETGLNDGPVALFKIHPGRPDTLYVGLATRGDRSFRSTDGGRTWEAFARDIAHDGLLDLAFDPVDSDTLYAANETGLWKSRDGGETWAHIDAVSAQRIAVSAPGTLLASRGCGLSRSTDDGRTWKAVIPCFFPGNGDDTVFTLALWVDPQNGQRVYAQVLASNGAGHQDDLLFRSDDGGATWQDLDVHSTVVAVSPSDFRTLYALDSRSGQILRSADGGESWQAVHSRPPYPDAYGVLAVDAADPDTLYVGSFQRGVLRSRDGGRTLKPLGGFFEESKRAARLLVTDRDQPGVLYAVAFDGGLFAGRFE